MAHSRGSREIFLRSTSTKCKQEDIDSRLSLNTRLHKLPSETVGPSTFNRVEEPRLCHSPERNERLRLTSDWQQFLLCHLQSVDGVPRLETMFMLNNNNMSTCRLGVLVSCSPADVAESHPSLHHHTHDVRYQSY